MDWLWVVTAPASLQQAARIAQYYQLNSSKLAAVISQNNAHLRITTLSYGQVRVSRAGVVTVFPELKIVSSNAEYPWSLVEREGSTTWRAELTHNTLTALTKIDPLPSSAAPAPTDP